MNCHAVRAVSDLHAEGRLSAPRAAAVAAHLAGCAACRGAAAPAVTAVRAAVFDTLLALRRDSGCRRRRRPEAGARRPPAVAAASRRRERGSAAVALALVALIAGWSGAPNQSFYARDEIAGRTR